MKTEKQKKDKAEVIARLKELYKQGKLNAMGMWFLVTNLLFFHLKVLI